jgi:sterol desaturase/sphingolipid hydroxylase (fatty acid hydroxylase superfamily)
MTSLAVQRLEVSPITSAMWEASPQWLAVVLLRGLQLVGIDIDRVAEKSFYTSPVDIQETLATSMEAYIIPSIQLMVALFVSDTWQYFVHRWCHTNKFMYSEWNCPSRT